jgi:hypothetical protein
MDNLPKVHFEGFEWVDIENLKFHPKNRNKHPKDQIERLAKILDYQGFRYPVKVSKLSGFVTSGHGRIEAAKINGWTKVPVSFQEYESSDQEYADLTADNAIASWAELDFSGINVDLADLGPELDLEMLGLKDFVLDLSETFAEKPEESGEKSFVLEVQCPNEMEMMDIHDDLHNRGYIVRIK